MHALTILIVLAMRVFFVLALDNPNGLVQVSVGDGRYYFSPNQLTAPSGTRVRFYFYGNYSVVQSTFDNPCRPAPNAFYSGFVSSSLSGALAPIDFTITLNDTDPIWFYCSQENFCQRNMVGVINPPEDKTKNLSVFAAQAALQTENISPDGGVNGGTLALLDSSPVSSTPTATYYGLFPSKFTGTVRKPLFPSFSRGIATVTFSMVLVKGAMAAAAALLVIAIA
ncbi:hypothetical protein MMC29_005088 [Sticta canariensis]|nr:hypothetical protein [Sticta canariensis]